MNSISQLTSNTFAKFFGDDEDPAVAVFYSSQLFGLPFPNPSDTQSTEELISKFHTEASLLKVSLGANAVPQVADDKVMRRYIACVAV